MLALDALVYSLCGIIGGVAFLLSYHMFVDRLPLSVVHAILFISIAGFVGLGAEIEKGNPFSPIFLFAAGATWPGVFIGYLGGMRMREATRVIEQKKREDKDVKKTCPAICYEGDMLTKFKTRKEEFTRVGNTG